MNPFESQKAIFSAAFDTVAFGIEPDILTDTQRTVRIAEWRNNESRAKIIKMTLAGCLDSDDPSVVKNLKYQMVCGEYPGTSFSARTYANESGLSVMVYSHITKTAKTQALFVEGNTPKIHRLKNDTARVNENHLEAEPYTIPEEQKAVFLASFVLDNILLGTKANLAGM